MTCNVSLRSIVCDIMWHFIKVHCMWHHGVSLRSIVCDVSLRSLLCDIMCHVLKVHCMWHYVMYYFKVPCIWHHVTWRHGPFCVTWCNVSLRCVRHHVTDFRPVMWYRVTFHNMSIVCHTAFHVTYCHFRIKPKGQAKTITAWINLNLYVFVWILPLLICAGKDPKWEERLQHSDVQMRIYGEH